MSTPLAAMMTMLHTVWEVPGKGFRQAADAQISLNCSNGFCLLCASMAASAHHAALYQAMPAHSPLHIGFFTFDHLEKKLVFDKAACVEQVQACGPS